MASIGLVASVVAALEAAATVEDTMDMTTISEDRRRVPGTLSFREAQDKALEMAVPGYLSVVVSPTISVARNRCNGEINMAKACIQMSTGEEPTRTTPWSPDITEITIKIITGERGEEYLQQPSVNRFY